MAVIVDELEAQIRYLLRRQETQECRSEEIGRAIEELRELLHAHAQALNRIELRARKEELSRERGAL